jgi:hypothetical protein
VNAIGVLSKVDQLTRQMDAPKAQPSGAAGGVGGWPIAAAAPIATRVGRDLRGLVSDVVPVIGLLAETAHAARFTEEDARAIAALAAVDDELDREDMLMSPEDFLRFEGIDLSPEVRHRLLDQLDLYGLQVAIAAVDAGARGASGILRALDERSGFAPLREMILDRFSHQADMLKAHAALCDMRRISYLKATGDDVRVLRSLRSPLERIELDPEMHQLRVLEVMQATASGELALPDDLMHDLEALCAGTDPTARVGVSSGNDAAPAALDKATHWGAWANDPRRSPNAARLGRIVKQAYEVLYTQVAEAAS